MQKSAAPDAEGDSDDNAVFVANSENAYGAFIHVALHDSFLQVLLFREKKDYFLENTDARFHSRATPFLQAVLVLHFLS